MSFQRLIIAFLITIGLFSSTSGAAYSQGRMAGGQSITICSPDGVHEIILGADGEPVPSEHECAECCFIALDAQVAANHIAPSPINLTRIVLPMTTMSWPTRSYTTANARAPPVVV
jgi:hypothetical protein